MMQDFFENLITNKMFYAPVLSWLAAQLIKTVIDVIPALSLRRQDKKDNVETEQDGFVKDIAQSILWRTGGMPSSHSSMSTALVTTIGFQEGVTSVSFLIAFFFTTIVIRDAVGVRRMVGLLGHQVNELTKEYNKINKEAPIEELKVVEGHSTSEVTVGVVLGFFVGLTVSLF